MNKLTYIHTNTRVLTQTNKKLKDSFSKSLYTLSNQEKVELENIILEEEFSNTNNMNGEEMDTDEAI